MSKGLPESGSNVHDVIIGIYIFGTYLWGSFYRGSIVGSSDTYPQVRVPKESFSVLLILSLDLHGDLTV